MPDKDGDFTPGTRHRRQMCATCRARLNPKEAPDGTVTFVHGTWADHEARPVNEVPEDTILICDFCLEPHPTWDFPCSSDRPVTASNGSDTTIVSVSDWASCNTCKNLIMADRYPDLVERIMNGRVGVDPGTDDMMRKSSALALTVRLSLMQQMSDFREARTGPPIPIATAQWVAAKLATMFGEDDAPVSYHQPSPRPENPR